MRCTVSTSNPVCIKEIAIKTSFSHIISIAGILYYTCCLGIDIHCTRYKMPSTDVFNELCIKTTLLRSIPNKL